jgi:hypothetical protein
MDCTFHIDTWIKREPTTTQAHSSKDKEVNEVIGFFIAGINDLVTKMWEEKIADQEEKANDRTQEQRLYMRLRILELLHRQ